MGTTHIVAVFKAEYYTTTARFRSYRKWIPILFLAGVIIFSFMLRVFYDILRQDVNPVTPDIPTFYSIITIFSYFTLFAPLLSPLGKIVYDGGAKSRREVALSSPVSSRDLLYGNLLSNLAFFLPFFAFVGTASLAPFIGNGKFNAILTSSILFVILSILILIGLIAGTIISPILFNFISHQKSDIARAIITLSVSALMVVSLPLLRYFMENISVENSNIGILSYFPFSLAASVIIYTLYGVQIGLSPITSIILLLGYILVFVLLGWKSAGYLYSLTDEEIKKVTEPPNSRKNRIINVYTRFLPTSLRNTTRSMLRASLRDLEHLSRLTIGLSITVFMIFALSSRGLFRTAANFTGNIELAVTIFSIVLSAASVIFIEASSFTVQHRDMLSLIKSAPNGSKHFVNGKVIQMILLIIPIYEIMLIILAFFNFIEPSHLLQIMITSLVILFTLISMSMAIFLINPADNEEDLTNFINLLVFYVFAFVIAIAPVYAAIAEINITLFHYSMYFGSLLFVGVVSLKIAVRALDEMNLETLDSDFSLQILQVFQVIILFLLGWNTLPILAVIILIIEPSLVLFLISSSIMTLILPLIAYRQKIINSPFLSLNQSRENWKSSLIILATMYSISFVIILIASQYSTTQSSLSIFVQFGISNWQIIIITFFTVISEELFFRWFIYDYSKRKLSVFNAIILNGFVFSIIHIFSIFSFVNAFIQATLLSLLKEKTGSIIYPIIIHLIFNLSFLYFLLI